MYLEPIFGSPDIIEQMPREGTLFQTTNIVFRKIMKDAESFKIMIDVCCITNSNVVKEFYSFIFFPKMPFLQQQWYMQYNSQKIVIDNLNTVQIHNIYVQIFIDNKGYILVYTRILLNSIHIIFLF